MPTLYINASELVEINEEVTDGHAAIRDLHLLNSAVLRPSIVLFGQPQFPTVLDKAAALMHSLAYHHLFYDGNKRTAVVATGRFLERNGYVFDYEVQRDYEYILDIAKGNHTPEAIVEWLREHSHPRQSA